MSYRFAVCPGCQKETCVGYNNKEDIYCRFCNTLIYSYS